MKKEILKDLLYGAFVVISAIVILDLFGFITWRAFSQTPSDGYYFGVITEKALQTITKN